MASTKVNNNELMQSLVSDVSMAFDSLNSKNEAGAELPPTTLSIYKAASLLYQINNSNYECNRDNLKSAIGQLNKVFESLLSSTEDEYLSSVILNDINSAFDKLIENAKSSLEQLTSRNNSRAKQQLEQNLSKCFSAMKPLQIIYGHGRGDVQVGGGSSQQQSRCCRLGFRPQLCSQIVFLYDAAYQCQLSVEDQNQESQETKEPALSSLQRCILNTLSSLLIHGLMSELSLSSEDDAIQSVMQLVQSMASDQSSTCLGDVLQWQRDNSDSIAASSLEKMIDSEFSNQVHAQKEYLLLMLSSAKKSASAAASSQKHAADAMSASKPKPKSKAKPQVSGLDRLVIQIKDLFPSYGEGYIEAALACYNHDLERTTVALLEVQSDPTSKSVHPRLRALDSSLPSRRKERKQRYDDADTAEDMEAKTLQKAHLRELAVQQENEAFLLEGAMGEYDDDYDDQYDGAGGEDDVGGADSGLYDMDYEAIKVYNKAAISMEEDRVFWEEGRNTNRRSGNGKVKGSKGRAGGKLGAGAEDINNGDDNTTEKKFRGPDKGKGGRLVGPDGRYLPLPKARKRGGQNQNQPAATNDSKSSSNLPSKKKGAKDGSTNGKKETGGDEKKKKDGDAMTKIQKRRKNDNKAKIGNHHRKERAMKKAAF